MTTRILLPLTFVLSTACVGMIMDSDDDGLNNRKERKLGTDADDADSDNDGLTDFEEVELGTDPTDPDTDGDGYDDGDEVDAGSDPEDDGSLIYEGGWPFNGQKDAIDDPGWDDRIEEGELMPRFIWLDQYEQPVDIYDFANQGKPVVFDISGLWCGWCLEMAKWLDYEDSAYTAYAESWGTEDWAYLVPDLVADGEIYWVTIIYSGRSGQAATWDDVEWWYEEFPNPEVPVLLEEDSLMINWLNPVGFPTLFMVEDDMTVGFYDKNDYTRLFDELVDRYGD